MAKVYSKMKSELESKGYMPFVCIIEWPPESEPSAIERYVRVFRTPEGKGVKGVHTWNLIGRNMMIVIGWTNSSVSIQKFCTSVTYGTDIRMEVCPAIDHDNLMLALTQLKDQLGKVRNADVDEQLA